MKDIGALMMAGIQEAEMPDRLAMYALPETTSESWGQGAKPAFPSGWTTIESNIKCRFVSGVGRGSESQIAGQVESVIEGEIIKPLGTAIPRAGYRIRRTAASGRVTDYEVIAEPNSSQISAIHIIVVKVD
jgi:hypothetical protein